MIAYQEQGHFCVHFVLWFPQTKGRVSATALSDRFKCSSVWSHTATRKHCCLQPLIKVATNFYQRIQICLSFTKRRKPILCWSTGDVSFVLGTSVPRDDSKSGGDNIDPEKNKNKSHSSHLQITPMLKINPHATEAKDFHNKTRYTLMRWERWMECSGQHSSEAERVRPACAVSCSPHTFPSLPSLMRHFPLHLPGAAGREEEGVNETTIFVALCVCAMVRMKKSGYDQTAGISTWYHRISFSMQFFVKWNKVIWSLLLKL